MTQVKTWRERRDEASDDFWYKRHLASMTTDVGQAFSFEAGFDAGRSDLMKDVEGLVEALKIMCISDSNALRLDQVDVDTLKMIVLHCSKIAKEALAKFEEAVK